MIEKKLNKRKKVGIFSEKGKEQLVCFNLKTVFHFFLLENGK